MAMKTRITCTLDQQTLDRLRKVAAKKHYTITQQVVQWIWAESLDAEELPEKRGGGAYGQGQLACVVPEGRTSDTG